MSTAFLGVVCAWMAMAGSLGQRQQPAAPVLSADQQTILRNLTPEGPDGPASYVLLAEEIADTAVEAPQIDLAKSLYALGYELARAAGQNGLAATACLGLAAIERLEQDRRWLLAVAAAVDPRYARPDWAVAASAAPTQETALRAAEAIGLARAGEGREAHRRLDEPAVRALIADYDRALGATGASGAAFKVDKAASEWPCPECANRRVVSRTGPGGGELRICPVCRGNPGPLLTHDEFMAQLRFEATLLQGIQRSWAAQLAVDLGAPLRDPDPDQLAAAYGVDVKRPYWRSGQWVAQP